MNPANLVTLTRIALTPVFVLAVWRASQGASGWPAAALFAVIAASDFLDGRVARRLAVASPLGRVLDHAADIGFLLVALITYVALGAAPWWVPASIAASFGFYVADSLRRDPDRPRLVGSRLGHLGGIANYVLVGVLVGNVSVGLGWLPSWLMTLLFLAVPVYSGASIVSRWYAARRAPY
ncbi:MAG: CDP-alcohol phosphatidyltransferase family protein [Deltaproteobacteria bacterium]|nr:CDP-alcohol phosphatidyltransferase family protein [Deltaproteobacteria bacterium]